MVILKWFEIENCQKSLRCTKLWWLYLQNIHHSFF